MTLLASNYRCRCGEIDLVMQDGDHIVFAEVRYRERQSHGGALGSISRKKIDRLRKAAAIFLQQHDPKCKHPCRFDVVIPDPPARSDRCVWIRDAF